MEGAVRLFAGEFNRSTLVIPGNDGKSAAWVVTPSGTSCYEVFIAGALVEVQEQGDMLSLRVADPTGGFDLVSGGNNTALVESIRKIPVPSFISVIGRAHLYWREGKPVPVIRPDQVHMIDRQIRDHWVIITAKFTLSRLKLMHNAVEGTCTDSRILQAYAHYSITARELLELAEMAAGALSSVRPTQEMDEAVHADTRDMIMEYIHNASGPGGVAVEEILEIVQMKGVSRTAALSAIESLIVEDECYQPRKGYVKPL